MKKQTLVHAACLLACAASPFAAQSQSGSPANAADTPEIIVTASRSEQVLKDALPASTLITRNDIERSQAQDLPTLMRQIAGVEVGQNGGQGSAGSLFLRGANSSHTLVLIDGVPANNLLTGGASIEHIALSNVERIEIVRGNVSSLYGSAAIGGVIQIFTRESVNTQHASIGLQKGSFGSTLATASGAIKLKNDLRLSASVESLSTSGIDATSLKKTTENNPDFDGYKRQAYSLGARQSFANGSVGLTTRSSKGRTQYDSGDSTRLVLTDASDFVSQATILDGVLNINSALKLKASVTSSSEKYSDSTAYPGFTESRNKQNVVGLDWQFAKGQLISTSLESSAQGIASDNQTIYTKTSRTQNSKRLGYLGNFEQHQIQASVRQDQYSDFGNASTHYLGYAYHVTSAWRVNVSSSTGFKAPTFSELYYPDYGYGGGNPNLKSERIQSSELGLQYVQSGHDLRAVWFDNRFQDLISSWPPVNVNKARNQGVELAYKIQMKSTTIQSGLTLQNPTNLTTNKRLARRADSLGFFNIQHDLGMWRLGGNLKYVGTRMDNEANTNLLQSYTLLDLMASYALTSSVRLTARIDNASNQKYETAFGYNQPGRAIYMGLNWQLK